MKSAIPISRFTNIETFFDESSTEIEIFFEYVILEALQRLMKNKRFLHHWELQTI